MWFTKFLLRPRLPGTDQEALSRAVYSVPLNKTEKGWQATSLKCTIAGTLDHCARVSWAPAFPSLRTGGTQDRNHWLFQKPLLANDLASYFREKRERNTLKSSHHTTVTSTPVMTSVPTLSSVLLQWIHRVRSYQRPARALPSHLLWTPQLKLSSSTQPTTTPHLFLSPLDDSYVNNKYISNPSGITVSPTQQCITTSWQRRPLSVSTLSMTPAGWFPPWQLQGYRSGQQQQWPLCGRFLCSLLCDLTHPLIRNQPRLPSPGFSPLMTSLLLLIPSMQECLETSAWSASLFQPHSLPRWLRFHHLNARDIQLYLLTSPFVRTPVWISTASRASLPGCLLGISLLTRLFILHRLISPLRGWKLVLGEDVEHFSHYPGLRPSKLTLPTKFSFLALNVSS